MSTPVQVKIYSRTDCHLCDVAKAAIESVRDRTPPFEMSVQLIDDNPELESLYGMEIPVVFVAGRKAFKGVVSPNEFAKRVERAAGMQP